MVFNFKILSSLLGHYFSTLVLWFSSMCVQILDLIRQPWGLGILLRAEFRAHNGFNFIFWKGTFLILCPSIFTRYSIIQKSCENKNGLRKGKKKIRNGILLPRLFLPTVRKKYAINWEKVLKFEAEGREFAIFLKLLEQLIRKVKGQNNFW